MVCLAALREDVRPRGIVPSRGLALRNVVATTADPVPVLQNEQLYLLAPSGIFMLDATRLLCEFSRYTGLCRCFKVDGECDRLVYDNGLAIVALLSF